MGWGDELLAAGQARKLYERTKRPVMICGPRGEVRANLLWNGSPYIRQYYDDRADRIVNAPGHRPYIAEKTPTHWIWRDFEATPAEIFLSPDERAFAAAAAWGATEPVVLEWGIKPKASPNKAWPLDYWRELVEWLLANGYRPVSLGDPTARPPLPGVDHIATPTVRHAAAVLEYARAYVGVEGFLHHAAAAMGAPAVVMMGGYIGPRNTGYALPNHRYLTGGAKACGARFGCRHCEAAMQNIKPGDVRQALTGVLTNG